MSAAYKVSFYSGSSCSHVAQDRGKLSGSNTLIKRGVRVYLRSFSLSETEQNVLILELQLYKS